MNKKIIIISCLFLLIFMECCNYHTEIIERKLIAFSNGSKIEGNFWLFGGYINEKPVYFYLHESSKGGIKQDWVYATDGYSQGGCGCHNYEVVIFENNMQPSIQLIYKVSTGCNTNALIKSIITIPKNSIRREFSVDLSDN